MQKQATRGASRRIKNWTSPHRHSFFSLFFRFSLPRPVPSIPVPSRRELRFGLLKQRLLELVKRGDEDEALKFAAERLAPEGARDPAMLREIEEAVSLLAYEVSCVPQCCVLVAAVTVVVVPVPSFASSLAYWCTPRPPSARLRSGLASPRFA